jgi:hypothetical protein
MNDHSSGYLEFLVIKVEAIITRLIAPISLPYSQSLDVGSIVGVADCNFLIVVDVFDRSVFANQTSSCRSGVLLILSLTILVTCSCGCHSSGAMSEKAYQHLLRG